MQRSLVLALVLAASTPAVADVLLTLDGQAYPGAQRLQYDVATQVFHVDFNASWSCIGSTMSAPGPGLTLAIDNRYYALDGPITLDLSQFPARLVMTSAAGDLNCEADRIFSDWFVLGSL